MTDFSDTPQQPEKPPYLFAFFNGQGGANFVRYDAFDFENLRFIPDPDDDDDYFYDSLKDAVWAVEKTNHIVVGYSRRERFGVVVVDLRGIPIERREFVRLDAVSNTILAVYIDAIDDNDRGLLHELFLGAEEIKNRNM